jgi:hypothetical protein
MKRQVILGEEDFDEHEQELYDQSEELYDIDMPVSQIEAYMSRRLPTKGHRRGNGHAGKKSDVSTSKGHNAMGTLETTRGGR